MSYFWNWERSRGNSTKNNSERREVRLKIHCHLNFHLNWEIVCRIPSKHKPSLDVGAWSPISLPRCLLEFIFERWVLWKQLSRQPGLQGTSWVLCVGPASEGSGVPWGLLSAAYYSFISINMNNHLWLREIFFFASLDEALKKVILSFCSPAGF